MLSSKATSSIESHTDTTTCTRLPSSGKRISHVISSGREFYDDGYTEEERNADELPTADGLTKKSDVVFFGRSKELETLHKVNQQVILGVTQDHDDNTTILPAVLLWGISGTGKSRLSRQFLNEIRQQSSCYILNGKYDENTGSQDPFSAIVQALNDFSSQLTKGSVEELERIRNCIKAAFGNSDNEDISVLSTLINVVPSLSILSGNDIVSTVGSTDQSSTMEGSASVASSSSQYSTLQPTKSTRGVNESAWNQLQYIFLQFVKAVSTKECPVYLSLEDLQWSSPVALELLSNLISDPELKYFLFLGSIRQETNPHNDEVIEISIDSPLSTSFLSRLQSQQLTQITIQNLSLDDTKPFLASLLEDHPIDEDLHTLARKIYAKTQGNIFFTMQALEELQRNNVLVYSRISFQWEWNFGHADDESQDLPISNDIAGAIESKLKQLSQDLQDVLSVAAYVRATFDVATLLHVIQNEQRCGASSLFIDTKKPLTEKCLSILLKKAVVKQLLTNPIGGTKYRFAHDRIQQAAHGMVPYGEVRNMMRLRIGHCLLGLYRGHDIPIEQTAALSEPQANIDPSSTEDDHGLLFVAADHLNSVPTKDHLFSVTLNLEVGEQAIQMAALASAAAYLQKAVNELRRVRNPWEEHYDICLRLYRARCDVELSLGHFQLGYSLGDEVLAKAKTLDDKLLTHSSMAHGLGREDKHFESLNVCLGATTEMKEFPKRWHIGHIIRDMMKIKSFLKKNSDDEILQLPFMSDERKLISMKLSTELAVRAIMTQHMVTWSVAVCKHVRNTIEFGLCEDSAMAFAFYGVLSEVSGDQATAMRCATLAKRMLSKAKGKSLAGWVSFVTGAFVIPFRSPITDVIQEHRRGYTSSMEAGEFEIGFVNWQMSVVMAYIAGYELQPLVQATETTLHQSKMYRVESLGTMIAEYLSMMQMMIGKKPIDWKSIEESANRDIKREQLDPSQLIALNLHFYCRMVLATYFRKYDLGKKLAASYRHVSTDEKTCFALISRNILPGINAAQRYHETGRRKHARMLNKMLTEAKDIVKTRGSKFIHHVLMLKAELTCIQNKNRDSRDVKHAYDLAILVASNASFVQDAALTCELAGEYCIRAGCSKEETSAYFVKAVGLYEDWGCVVKVDDLKQRRSQYMAGLNTSTRVKNTRAQNDGILSNMLGNNSTPSRRARVDVLSTYTPSIPAMGSSVAGSGTKATHGLQESVVEEEDDCNLSVLTDGS